ncbi:MAG: hypothetical protein JWP52_358 [Rhizobacter sp.]|nr:hypothetical protein [Rhizobacter sp.]
MSGGLLALLLAAHFAAGSCIGLVYFNGLWWTTRRLFDETSIVAVALLLVGRFAVLAALLTLASFEGAMPLLALATGVCVARVIVVRRVRAVPSRSAP